MWRPIHTLPGWTLVNNNLAGISCKLRWGSGANIEKLAMTHPYPPFFK
jgi:hypothetical protein